MDKKAVIYSRVSSTGDRQDTSRQIRDLGILAKQRNLKIEKTYEEHISGKKQDFFLLAAYSLPNLFFAYLCREVKKS
ncbi:MAG: recombinase family protein [Bacteroidales bacterium]|nr:recombinase family protein [Bacteroidales bacterium]